MRDDVLSIDLKKNVERHQCHKLKQQRKLLSARDLCMSWFMTFVMFSNETLTTYAIISSQLICNSGF